MLYEIGGKVLQTSLPDSDHAKRRATLKVKKESAV